MIIIGFFVIVFLLAYNLVAVFVVVMPFLNEWGDDGLEFWHWFLAVFALVFEYQVYVWIKPWLVLMFPDLNWQ